MRVVLLSLVLVLGCKSESSDDDFVEQEESTGDTTLSTEDSDADGQLAQQGEVCRSGMENPDSINRGCAEGLRCCYPCGMEGCDHVCATPDECSAWSTLP